MIWIGYIVLGFTVIRFVVSLVNWITKPFLPENKPENEPMVSVLIPARNEGKTLENLLNSLNLQTYNNFEIIVCNDQSTDNTVSIVENAILTNPKIKLIHINELPHGWLGKNNACNQLAKSASGKYLCFLDADVTLSPHFLASALAYMQTKKLSLLTLFPQQILITNGEKATVPIMMHILLSLLPLSLVRIKFFPSLSAANGQCMFFSQSAYVRHYPHSIFKNTKAEDIAIARYFKKKKEPIACLLGNKQVFCRMYTNYTDAINGFAKNINAFFGNSYFLAFSYGLFSSVLLLPIWFFKNFELFILVFCLMFMTTLLNTINASLNLKGFVKYKFIHEFVFCNILYVSVKHKFKKTATWKGRNI